MLCKHFSVASLMHFAMHLIILADRNSSFINKGINKILWNIPAEKSASMWWTMYYAFGLIIDTTWKHSYDGEHLAGE